jgi:hypothetical protein
VEDALGDVHRLEADLVIPEDVSDRTRWHSSDNTCQCHRPDEVIVGRQEWPSLCCFYGRGDGDGRRTCQREFGVATAMEVLPL